MAALLVLVTEDVAGEGSALLVAAVSVAPPVSP